MHANGKSIYGCTFAPDNYTVPEDTRLTYNKDAKQLYVHLYQYPQNGKLLLKGYQGKVKFAQFLNDGSELKFAAGENASSDMVLTLPAKKPGYEIPVISLTLQ